MELHQLQCFIAVLEEGGFKRATARLGITQPALSYQIKQLEDELGVRLFHRRPGGITPSEAGRALLDQAHQIIATVHEAHQAVRELTEGVTGEIRVGTIKCVGTYFLPEVLWEIRAKHPLVRPRLQYGNSQEILNALLAHTLDAALVADPPPDDRLELEPVLEERISLVAGARHPLYGRPTVAAAELKDVDFIALSPDTATGALIRAYLEALGLALAPALSTDNIETVKRMVEAGMGVALLPDLATAEDVGRDGHAGRLARSALDPPLSRRVVLASWRQQSRSLPLAAFVEELRRMGRLWRESPFTPRDLPGLAP